MPLSLADRRAFVDSDLPGYVLATIDGVEVAALFGNAYAEALGMVSGAAPALICVAEDVDHVTRGDAVTIDGVSYTIEKPAQVEAGDLGPGMTRLLLQKA